MQKEKGSLSLIAGKPCGSLIIRCHEKVHLVASSNSNRNTYLNKPNSLWIDTC